MPYTTDQYEGMLAETVTIAGHGGDPIYTYVARPLGPGPHPGVVLIHHMPGWDEWYKEATRKFAYHGYAAICPDLYGRVQMGDPVEVGAAVRAQGGVPDAQVVGDVDSCLRYLRGQPTSNGKAGVFGTCSGGRHAYLAACQLDNIDAVADLWGGGVVMSEADITPNRPVSPLDYTANLSAPLLGLFGEDDRNPTPEQVEIQRAELEKHGKDFEFTMYPGAGHGFFYHDRPVAYRAEAAVDGWAKVFAFFEKHLRSG